MIRGIMCHVLCSFRMSPGRAAAGIVRGVPHSGHGQRGLQLQPGGVEDQLRGGKVAGRRKLLNTYVPPMLYPWN